MLVTLSSHAKSLLASLRFNIRFKLYINEMMKVEIEL